MSPEGEAGTAGALGLPRAAVHRALCPTQKRGGGDSAGTTPAGSRAGGKDERPHFQFVQGCVQGSLAKALGSRGTSGVLGETPGEAVGVGVRAGEEDGVRADEEPSRGPLGPQCLHPSY